MSITRAAFRSRKLAGSSSATTTSPITTAHQTIVKNRSIMSTPSALASSNSSAATSSKPTIKDPVDEKIQPQLGNLRGIILGAPGSGKGTQVERLLKNYNLEQVVLGNLLRQEVRNESELGRLALSYMQKGALVPDEVVIKFIEPEIYKLRGQNWILDGFPRTGKQAETLDKFLDKIGEPLNLIINLNVPDRVILQRIEDRWIHAPSGRTYNLSFNPPKAAGKDDITGEPLTKRPDDNPETFAKRLEIYHAENSTLLDHYVKVNDKDKDNLVHTLSGNTSDEIWPKLQTVISNKFPELPQITNSKL